MSANPIIFPAGRCAPNARVEGFDETLKRICRDVCAGEYGEPPCWDLPNLTSTAAAEVIAPCDECRRLAKSESSNRESSS